MKIISFIFGVVITFFVLSLVHHCKNNDPKNNVKFFISKNDKGCTPYLYSAKSATFYKITCDEFLKEIGLYSDDFADMKEGEMRKVFLK